ncbi:hypothetical protein AN643_03975 [Candidatus Epulonipiscioides saccharophilum]|nr:hypothetical protein AN643_03975 [Epulopiscium sp. SCG-B10WGA-EpuloB]
MIRKIALIILLIGIIIDRTEGKEKLTYKIVDTGADEFYGEEREIGMPFEGTEFYGQDATYQINEPSYTYNGDGTVTDNNTGLIWQQKMAPKMTYKEAEKYARKLTLGGYNDWRIPTIKELYSLIIFTANRNELDEQIYIDSDYFIQPIINDRFWDTDKKEQTWSSTKYVDKANKDIEIFYAVNFIDGSIEGYPRKIDEQSEEMYFRLVRGNKEYGKNKFINNNDGTITDLATGLMWQEKDSRKGMDWAEALDYCENSIVAEYTDWRLPNAKELQSIVDYKSAAIDPVFKITKLIDEDGNIQYPCFWTSTTYLNDEELANKAVSLSFGLSEIIGHDAYIRSAGEQDCDLKYGNPDNIQDSYASDGDISLLYNFVRPVRSITAEKKSSAYSLKKDARKKNIRGQTQSTIDKSLKASNSATALNVAITSDMHCDEYTDYKILEKTLLNINAQNPEFIIDLGDTLMLGNYAISEMEERALFVYDQLKTIRDITLYLVSGDQDDSYFTGVYRVIAP